VLRSQVLHLQQQVDQLNSKQVELLGQKQTLQIAHQQELARFGHLKTAEELQSMLTALQKEVDTNARHARKAAVSRVGVGMGGSRWIASTSALSSVQGMHARRW
jgi:TolA-binding protein